MNLLMATVLMEGVLILMLMMDGGPMHMLAVKLVSIAKLGKGPLIGKIVAGVTLINLASTLYVFYKIQRRSSKMAFPTAADHFMLRSYLLESLLKGFFVLLLLIMSRLHHGLMQVEPLRSEVERLKTRCQAMEEKYARLKSEKAATVERECAKALEESVSLKDLVSELRKKMENLQLESLEKDKVVKTAEANARALQKQSQGLLLEYDRLLEDNESLRSQLVSIDRKLSYSDSKKSS